MYIQGPSDLLTKHGSALVELTRVGQPEAPDGMRMYNWEDKCTLKFVEILWPLPFILEM